MAPLIGLAGTVPPEVVEQSRRTYKANMLAVASHFNRESRMEWRSMLRRFRVLSLCAEGKNALLWSHYADSHRGVALEFDASSTAAMPFVTAEPVKYRKRAPCAYSKKNFIEDALGLAALPDAARALVPLVMTKSVEWTHEREWRVVRLAAEGDQDLFSDLPFSPRSLSRIFLGCRISPHDKREISCLVTGDFAHVEIHQARQSPTRFALEFNRVR